MPVPIYLSLFWNSTELDYDGLIMVSLSLPGVVISRLSIVLNFGIAFDRFQVYFLYKLI